MPLLLLIAIAAFGLASERPLPDFSGSWKQSNELCSPQRTGEVTLKIEHRDPELVVETTSKGRVARRALQRYTTDGVESKSIGADGDEFHSVVVWKDGSLAFDIVEIEDGKRLKSTEVWRLIGGGKTLKRVRRAARPAGKRWSTSVHNKPPVSSQLCLDAQRRPNVQFYVLRTRTVCIRSCLKSFARY
jgi:hypothetical protein